MRKKTKTPLITRKRVINYGNVSKLIKLNKDVGVKCITIGPYGNTMYKTLNEYEESKDYDCLTNNTLFIEKDTKLEIVTKYYDDCKPCTYILDLNDEEVFTKTGLDTYRQFNRAFKVTKADTYQLDYTRWYDSETDKYVCSAKPILDYVPKYERQELKEVYEYDLNSAYSAIILKGIPDIAHPIYGGKVGKNQVGFLLDDDLTMTYKGEVDIRFNIIETPKKLKEYIYRWYERKKNSKGLAKQNAKAMLNLPIGYCQRTNPFFRAYVVQNCNRVIKALINDQTIMWNTDALFSLNRRVDLLLGDEIGMFKEIRLEKFIYIGNNYQVNDKKPTYRGVPKAWMSDDIEIGQIESHLVNRFNKYIWDPVNLTLKENKRTLYEEIELQREETKSCRV